MPPLNGNNRRVFELARALAPEWDLHLLVYLDGAGQRDAFRQVWSDTQATFHFFERRRRFRHLRSLLRGESLPTVDRDFPAEARLINTLTLAPETTRLLLDSHCVSPLAAHFRSGVVVSGPDCMSRQFGELTKHAKSARERWHNRVRRWFAGNNERRWYHLAEVVHVVSTMDREALKMVNPRANIEVIALGLAEPAESKLRPWQARQGGLVWGNLDFPPIHAGVKELIRIANGHSPGLLRGWKLLGKAPRDRAFAMFPGLADSGMEYLEWCGDVSSLLAQTQFVVCPDIGGAGQKNRCLDALAHGCLAVGLAEVFRDLNGESGRHYVEMGSFSELPAVLALAGTETGSGIAAAGKALFGTQFSHRALAAKWTKLLTAMGPLLPQRPS